MGSAAAATAASAESSESETDNNDERTNKFLLLVDQVSAPVPIHCPIYGIENIVFLWHAKRS